MHPCGCNKKRGGNEWSWKNENLPRWGRYSAASRSRPRCSCIGPRCRCCCYWSPMMRCWSLAAWSRSGARRYRLGEPEKRRHCGPTGYSAVCGRWPPRCCWRSRRWETLSDWERGKKRRGFSYGNTRVQLLKMACGLKWGKKRGERTECEAAIGFL